MSGANWRRAMNSGAGRATGARGWSGAAGLSAGVQRRPASIAGSAPADPAIGSSIGARLADLRRLVRVRHLVVMVGLLVYPWVASSFFVYQIGAQALVYGLIALSLTFLGGSGGMVSLSQGTVAGLAGYLLAIFGTSSVTDISFGWPWWVASLIGILAATALATLIGVLSVRTEGIYTIMITLAIGVAFFYLVQQNYTVFNGFQGFSRTYAPQAFGVAWNEPVAFYYLVVACSLAGYFAVKYVLRAPFGIALQGIRDNARRMNALGFSVNAHRVAAHAFAGVIAAVGGILLTWYNTLISPGTVSVTVLINILIIAVLGGMRHPIGPFIGAVVFVLLQNFAVDIVDRERFNLLIGSVFLAIVLFSPDGLLGLWANVRQRLAGLRSPNRGRRAAPTTGGRQ